MAPPKHHFKKEDQRNLLIALALSAILIITWQVLIEAPKRKQLAEWKLKQQKRERVLAKQEEVKKIERSKGDVEAILPRAERIAASPRIPIRSKKLHGTLALKGLRFDDMRLANYHVNPDPNSPEVTLLSPPGGGDVYFVQIGWVAGSGNVKVPDANSVWRTEADKIVPDMPIELTWDNQQGQRFYVTITLDDNYLFTVQQQVQNYGSREVSVVPYGLVNRTFAQVGFSTYIMHEGPLGVLDGTLSELAYQDLKDDGEKQYNNAKGWFGFTDKYWLAVLIPGSDDFKANFNHYTSKGLDRYQAEYTSPAIQLAPGVTKESFLRVFTGAKEIEVLDKYAEGKPGVDYAPPIPLFDRAVDFGMLYFMTKPMFLLLDFFYKIVMNFGLAIIMMTVLIKAAMFPLANKGYRATSALRALQPEMTELKERHGEDRVKFQQELIALYKREKVNPAAGCLPLLVQIPVFFALYKVLYVTIEMRHAPFYGWLVDLSAPDPSNVFTLFGLIPWEAPMWAHVGVLPVLMGISMFLQMRMQPKPTDPTQAQIFKWMPFVFTFMLAKMPAGLVLYWTCSNALSILQQWVIMRQYVATHPKAKKAAEGAK